jgi:hypothetical protein
MEAGAGLRDHGPPAGGARGEREPLGVAKVAAVVAVAVLIGVGAGFGAHQGRNV